MARFLILVLFIGALAQLSAAESEALFDVRSIPIADWMDGGNRTEIPWKVEVRAPVLRMDQRMEVSYSATMSGKNLNQSGPEHELFLISRISNEEGEWLTPFAVASQDFDRELPNGHQVRFTMRAMVKPGSYSLWMVLYDRKTGRHNSTRRRIEVREIDDDPLPYAYMSLPLAEFPRVVTVGDRVIEQVATELNLSIENKTPLDVRIISPLSPPEQYATRARFLETHSNYLKSALDAISQVELQTGTMSISGLDLTHREVVFHQQNYDRVDRLGLSEGFEKANSGSVSAAALQGRKENGAFFRDFVDGQLGEGQTESPLRVFIIVSSSVLFDHGANLEPLELEADCHCRVYHIRFRLSPRDVFDHLQTLIKPLRPKTYNILTARDFRKALADILHELEAL